MSRPLELTGQRFGKLTVIRRNGSKNSKAYWLCQCDCGKQVSVVSNALSGNKTKSCGCVSVERIRNLNKGKSLVEDIVGNKYGRLVVLEFSHLSDDRKRTYWKCVCDCGNEIVTRGDSLKNGHTNSCGCYNKEIVSQTKGATTHGLTNTRLYRIYTGMKSRCYNHNMENYKYFKQLLIEFNNFIAYHISKCFKNIYKEDLTIKELIEKILSKNNIELDIYPLPTDKINNYKK